MVLGARNHALAEEVIFQTLLISIALDRLHVFVIFRAIFPVIYLAFFREIPLEVHLLHHVFHRLPECVQEYRLCPVDVRFYLAMESRF